MGDNAGNNASNRATIGRSTTHRALNPLTRDHLLALSPMGDTSQIQTCLSHVLCCRGLEDPYGMSFAHRASESSKALSVALLRNVYHLKVKPFSGTASLQHVCPVSKMSRV